MRVDLENKNQTLKEDLQFKSQIYEKEIDQLRSSKRVEIEQVDVRLRDEYDSRLVAELQRIRDETEYKIREMKDEVERRYQNKFADSETSVKRSQQQSSVLRGELINYKSKIDEAQGDIKNLQTKLNNYELKIKDLEEKLKRAHAKYDKDITEKDNEIDSCRKEMQELLLDYQELYDIKIALDMEIAAYRKLLESEEQRLNISTAGGATIATSLNLHGSFLNESAVAPTSSTMNTSITRSGKKRRLANTSDDGFASASAGTQSAYIQTEESKCGIQIGEHDFDGRCVKLINTTDKDIAIGGWVLRRVADGQETDYKFTKTAVIKAKQQLNVWSSNSGVTHEPSSDIVTTKKWVVGDKMITVLNDKDGNEQSRRESQKNIISVGLEKRLRATPPRSGSSLSTTTTSTEIRLSGSNLTAADASNASSSVQKFFGFWKS